MSKTKFPDVYSLIGFEIVHHFAGESQAGVGSKNMYMVARVGGKDIFYRIVTNLKGKGEIVTHHIDFLEAAKVYEDIII